MSRWLRRSSEKVPEVDTLAELNETARRDRRCGDSRHVHGSNTSVGFGFAVEQKCLAGLPDDFDCGIALTPTVRRDSRIVVRQCYYSVPARFIGRQVRVSLRANELLIFDRNKVVARHPRPTRRHHHRDGLDHHLENLMVRPGALAGSTGLAQARAAGTFTAAHDALWAAARAAHGDAAGTRVLIEVLLHRGMPHESVLAWITAALQAGSSSPEQVAIEARNAERPAEVLLSDEDLTGAEVNTGAPAENGIGNVITPPARRPAIPEDTHPIPSVAANRSGVRAEVTSPFDGRPPLVVRGVAEYPFVAGLDRFRIGKATHH
jgi:hypothetical protein